MDRRPAWKQAIGLLAWLAASFVAAGVGGIASANAGAFYQSLARPSWAPPGWLFGPVWTVLYTLMGIAAWLVWRARGWRHARGALSLFVVQLGLNALWSWLFFGWRLGAASFAGVVVLWVLIAWTLAAFWRVRALAGALLIPYLLWVGFAAALTYAIWRLNPQAL